MCVCVCVCVYSCVYLCVYVCARARIRVHVSTCVCAGVVVSRCNSEIIKRRGRPNGYRR